MPKFMVLAFRNVFRNRRRTIMMLLVTSGGVAAMLLVGGFFSYMFHGIRENTINNGLGHLQLFNSEHFERDEVHVLDTGMTNWQQVADHVRTTEHVRGVAPRIDFYGMLSNGVKSGVFMGSAVNPSVERGLGFTTNITSGRNLSDDSNSETEAIIGAGLAKSMNVRVGGQLSLMSVTSQGALNGVDINIVGIVDTGVKEMDERYLRITLPAAQRLLQSDRITYLVVGLDKTENTDRVADRLRPMLQSSAQHITLKKWSELATMYQQIRSMFTGIFVFQAVIVIFMTIMSSANSLMMAMFERTREIGTMLAMGTERSSVISLFVMEGTLQGVFGAAAGLLLGNLLIFLLNAAHLHLPPPPGGTSDFPFVVFYSPFLMLGTFFMIVVSLALASVLPALRASKMQIVEALAHV